MSGIKVGLLGTGHSHAAGKLAVLRASRDYQVLGVAEPDAELRAHAQHLPIFRDLPFVSETQLLEMPGLDLIVVETAVPQQLAAAGRVVAAGKHLHLEKPGSASLAGFRDLLDVAARKHLHVQMGYMYRYNPGMVFLRKALAEGWLGSPFEVHAVMSKVVAAGDRAELAEYAGGMMFELGSHLIDLTVAILGKPTKVDAYRQLVGSENDALADNTLAVLTCGGALATIKSSGVEVEGGGRRHFVLCGTEGTCHVQPLDEPHVRLTLARPCGPYRKGTQAITFGEYPRYVGDFADLARIIRGEKEPDYSYSHDLAVLETILQAAGMPTDA